MAKGRGEVDEEKEEEKEVGKRRKRRKCRKCRTKNRKRRKRRKWRRLAVVRTPQTYRKRRHELGVSCDQCLHLGLHEQPFGSVCGL